MIKKIIYPMILAVVTLSSAQTFQMEINSIPVTIAEKQLSYPWNGGLNFLSLTMPDLDNDGDYDLLFTGSDDGRLYYYLNNSDGLNPLFNLQTHQLNDVYFGNQNSRMALDDLDFDGDLDLVVGDNYGMLDFYRNDGTAAQPQFIFVTDQFASIDVGYQATPAFADLNGDGLNDLIIGSYNTGLQFFTRDDSTSLAFTAADTLRDESGVIIDPGYNMSLPALADIDNDGDFDLFVSSTDDNLLYYNNTGSIHQPRFTLSDGSFLTPPDWMSFLTPAFVDIDGDEDLDLFFGSNHGFITFYRNQGTPAAADFILESKQLPLDYMDFGFYSSPFLIDIDGDMDKDLFVSNSNFQLHYFENTGSVSQPQFTWRTDRFQDVDEHARTQAWGDLDNDGDFDLLFCGFTGYIYKYLNTGDAATAALVPHGILKDSLGNQFLGDRADLVDFDADSDLDLATNISFGIDDAIFLYENVGSPDSMILVARDTLRDDNNEIISFFDGFFRFVDFDDNGRLDLFIGHGGQSIARYEAVDTAGSYRFHLQDASFAGIVTDNDRILPFLTDIDGDNQMDLFWGRFRGGLFYYHNSSASVISENTANPFRQFILNQNYPNPFNPATTINYELPIAKYVELSIYNLLGQKIATLVDQKQPAGRYQLEWDASAYPSGIYFYTLKTDAGRSMTKKMLLLR